MYLDEVRDFALAIDREVEECFPFGPETFVYKTSGKVFLLMSFDELHLRLNVKCDPDLAEELREMHSAIIPGFHMNKKHWNTLILDGSLPGKLIKDSIQGSYKLVAKKPKIVKRIKKDKTN